MAIAALGGCSKRALNPDGGVGNIEGGVVGSGGAGGHGNGQGTGGNGIAGQGAGGQATGGTAGLAAACSDASDPRLVVAGQRILRLTVNETLNTVRYLIDDTEAKALVTRQIVGASDSDPVIRRFPPLLPPSAIDTTELLSLDLVADDVAKYVYDNFASVTGCSPATDTCAHAYLKTLASRAYRRILTPAEQTRFDALYTTLRSQQNVNGYAVTFTIEEATEYSVRALFHSPQMIWRWEIGDPAKASTAPAGVPLTDTELATQLSFFLTDQPPDDMLIKAADAGTLRTNLATHVDRLLASPAAHDWLRTIMETYLTINQVPAADFDPNVFPVFTNALVADMELEARKFLDEALWNGNLTDLVLSRTAFLNTNLATNIYGVAVPAGATATNFVRTTLPAEQRAGLLTNAGFLTVQSRADGLDLMDRRGLVVAGTLLCVTQAPHAMAVSVAPEYDSLTSQEQAAMHAEPACNSCHGQLDPYGLALDNYDAIGRFRTVDASGRAIDAHAQLPALVGGGTVANGVDLAAKLAASPAFTNCMARTLLQHAMVSRGTLVELPLPPQQAGCATADLVQRYKSAGGKTFTDLVRATAASPAFGLRQAAQ
ncbi:MAG TPA: DUF1592 domain-containing protein [Polyangia bacterium]|nr:DUF1592 domain-containing protein [Polyangia bacterium]